MVPRGCLDICWRDLGRLLVRATALPRCHENQPWRCNGWTAVPALSCRTAWDAILAESPWQTGDELLVSSITIPDMVELVRHHQFQPVFVSLDFDRLTVAQAEIRKKLGPRTRVVLVAPLFGARATLDSLAAVTKPAGALLVEDAAQTYGDPAGWKSAADVSLWSFGVIKTATAGGGGLAVCQSAELAERLGKRLAHFPEQSCTRFLRRVCQMGMLRVLSTPLLFTVLGIVLRSGGAELDPLLNRATRGFAGSDLVRKLRQQPCPALREELRRRWESAVVANVAQRQARGEELWDRLDDVERPGTLAESHSHWVWPIVVSQPDEFVRRMQRLGYDATRRASRLAQFVNDNGERDDRWDRLVFLPNHPAVRIRALATAVRAALAESGP